MIKTNEENKHDVMNKQDINLIMSVYVFSERNFPLNLSITWLKSFKSPFSTAVKRKIF